MPPNFFIAGAPKCGTTALYHCLRSHPQVFLPYSREDYWRYKEPMHFCGDLGIADWLRIADKDDYEKIFGDAGDAKMVGEASAQYLFSEEAGGRIRKQCGPSVKIIILLRPPVEWMRSWHHDLLRYGYEDVGSFRLALDLEDARTDRDWRPKRAAFAGCLRYREMASFTRHVERMFDIFGREQVLVGLMEDLSRDRESFVKSVLEFLGVDASIVPDARRRNDSAILRRTHLFDLKVSRAFDRIPLGQSAKKCWNRGPGWLYTKAADRFLPPLSDKSIEPSLERELKEEFRDEVHTLSRLLGRDLSHWSA